ncbi:MAG: hypothetical protein ACFFAO_15105 [Candidatus Hermodarchaeota archaeon]
MKLAYGKWPLTCIAGILTFIIGNTLIIVSLILFPGTFNMFEKTISTLGNVNHNPSGAVFLRLSNILTGIFFIAFYLGLRLWYSEDSSQIQKHILKITIIIGCLLGFAGIMVGIFSQEYRPYHLIWAVIFFTLNFSSLLMMGIFLYNYFSSLKPIVIFNFIIVLLHVTLILVLTIDAVIFEWIVYFAINIDYLLLVFYFKNIHTSEIKSI